MPSFVLIHPSVCPQYTNVTCRTDRTDNGPIAYGKPFYKRSPKNRVVQKKTAIVKKKRSGFTLRVCVCVYVLLSLLTNKDWYKKKRYLPYRFRSLPTAVAQREMSRVGWVLALVSTPRQKRDNSSERYGLLVTASSRRQSKWYLPTQKREPSSASQAPPFNDVTPDFHRHVT